MVADIVPLVFLHRIFQQTGTYGRSTATKDGEKKIYVKFLPMPKQNRKRFVRGTEMEG